MKVYDKLSVKYGIHDEYKLACEKEIKGDGNGWRIDIEKAIDMAEKGGDIASTLRYLSGRSILPVSHTESGLRYRG